MQMTKTRIAAATLAAAACLAAPGAAEALDRPKASVHDSHMRTAVYREGQVYPVHAVNGFVSTIIFEQGETVQAHSSGFSSAWEFAARENHFFLKPAAAHGTTNLVIVTDRRTYLFDIILASDKSRATYVLRFTYPDEAARRALEEAEREEVKRRLARPLAGSRSSSAPAEKRKGGTSAAGAGTNRSYTMNFGSEKSSRSIAPLEAFDDGRFTYLRFRKQADWPAAYRVLEEGGEHTETLLNSHVEGDWLVVHGVYESMRLRAGLGVVGIYNEAYDGGGAGSGTGTAVPGLVREIRTNAKAGGK